MLLAEKDLLPLVGFQRKRDNIKHCSNDIVG
jgi:hypothetical protein